MARLQRNKDRREARERAKGRLADAIPASPMGTDVDTTELGSVVGDPSTPAAGASTGTPGVKPGKKTKATEATARKCANCGQVGHIRTNKK